MLEGTHKAFRPEERETLKSTLQRFILLHTYGRTSYGRKLWSGSRTVQDFSLLAERSSGRTLFSAAELSIG